VVKDKLRDGAVKALDVKNNIEEIKQFIEESKEYDLKKLRGIIINEVNYNVALLNFKMISVSVDTGLNDWQQGTKSQTKLKEKVDRLKHYLEDISKYWINLTHELMFYEERLKYDIDIDLLNNTNKKIKENKNALMMIYIFNYLPKMLSLFANIKEKINIYQNDNNDSIKTETSWAKNRADLSEEEVEFYKWEIDQSLENALSILREQTMLRSNLLGLNQLMEAYDPNVAEDQKNLKLIKSVVDIQPGNKPPSKGNVK